MEFGPITLWQIEGEKVETVTDFIFLGSKILADGDWSKEIKRCLLLERKAVANLESILKSRDITLLTEIHKVKAMAFPVVMKESFPRQVDKKSWGPQGRGVWNSIGGRQDILFTFFPPHFLGLYNKDVPCLRTVSGLNLLANSVILKCKLWE